jgi:hypothetical protein
MADKIYSEETNAERRRKEVLERADQAQRLLQDAAAKALAVLTRVESEIAAPPEPEPESHEAEVRVHLRTLNDKDRAVVFADAVKRDDVVTIGAVLRSEVPVMLTGMDGAEREARRREWQRNRYLVELDRHALASQAPLALERASTEILKTRS